MPRESSEKSRKVQQNLEKSPKVSPEKIQKMPGKSPEKRKSPENVQKKCKVPLCCGSENTSWHYPDFKTCAL